MFKVALAQFHGLFTLQIQKVGVTIMTFPNKEVIIVTRIDGVNRRVII
jgi:hypothetical protein